MFSYLSGKTNAEVYDYVFKTIMMRTSPTKKCILGNSQREHFLPLLDNVFKKSPNPEHFNILDIGAGSGEIVDFFLHKLNSAKLYIEEPNELLLSQYKDKLKKYGHIQLDGSTSAQIQDLLYTEEGKKWLKEPPPFHVILAIHMIYHLTNFNATENITPENDIIDMITTLYEKLEVGGVIFIVYAEQLESYMGGVSCEYFKINSVSALNNMRSIWRAREFLFRKGAIKDVLLERYPEVKCDIQNKITYSRVYGRSLQDIALICLIAEMCPYDNRTFNLMKLNFIFNEIKKNMKRYDIKIEESDSERNGMWSAKQPQVICVIKKMRR